MALIGVLGGLGPAATVDFLDKLVRLTPATRDQEHIPTLVASLPHVPDRSAYILGQGPDPLPALLRGLDLLLEANVGLVVIPCNSAHHWYRQLSDRAHVPILHIAEACVAGMQVRRGQSTLVLATRGALRSGFYQRALEQAGARALVPDPEELQPRVDDCIRLVKAGRMEEAGAALGGVLAHAHGMGVRSVIMGCTEIPIAAQYCDTLDLALADSSLALAQAAVDHAMKRGWHRAGEREARA